jgi:low affinity Fe/Cu permease
MILDFTNLPLLHIIRAIITLVLTNLRSVVLNLGGRPAHFSSTWFLRILLRVAVLLREAFVFVIIVVLQGSVMRAVPLSCV